MKGSGWRPAAGAGQLAPLGRLPRLRRMGRLLCHFCGLGGALSEDYRPGRAYRITGVVDSQTGERFGDSGSCGIRKRRDDRGPP